MSELPALTPQALLARTDQVARIGGSRTHATDIRGDEPDYELELHGRALQDGVHESEAITAVHEQRGEPDEQRPRHERRAREPEDDDDEPPHLLDVTA
jgi:hypothetical protein